MHRCILLGSSLRLPCQVVASNIIRFWYILKTVNLACERIKTLNQNGPLHSATTVFHYIYVVFMYYQYFQVKNTALCMLHRAFSAIFGVNLKLKIKDLPTYSITKYKHMWHICARYFHEKVQVKKICDRASSNCGVEYIIYSYDRFLYFVL